MTMPLPGKAFALGVPVRMERTSADASLARSRILAVAVTAALHVMVIVALIAGVHAAALKMAPGLTVHINLPEQKKDRKIAPPPPQLQKPQPVMVPPPEFQMQVASSPIVVQQQPLAAPVPPPATTAGVPKATGEGRDRFLGRLLAQLNRFKQYPRAARQAHIQGVVMLRFVMDANGAVQSAEVAKSSGYPVLDAEALALIRRAQPLPALPPDFPTRTVDAVVPIAFALDC